MEISINTTIIDDSTSKKLVYDFDNFITCEGNIIAYNAAKAVACEHSKAFNPLFIYGGSGTGKTHLLKAVEGTLNDRNPEQNVLYVTSEEFINDISAATNTIDNYGRAMIRETYRYADVLLIDDIQYLVGEKAALTELGHAIDTLLRNGSQIFFSSDKPPKKMKFDEHMKIRMGMGLIAEIKAPDSAMKSNLVRMKAAEHGLMLRDEVVEYITFNTGTNLSEVEGAITSIIAYLELSKPTVTLEMAKNILKDVICTE
ncbi:chromosomal replication initiator protein DnaA [Lachnospiraceae bacterium]|nr:chromosomal replication initiator protein DnaA [Lachnospiraceae bacterium]